MSEPIHSSNITIVTVIVGILLVAVGFVMWLPANTRHHGGSRQMANITQLRGIHQSMVIYAQSNKSGGQDGWFPGLDSVGDVIPDGPGTGQSGDGLEPSARIWILLENNAFTPEYAISPADAHITEAVNAGGNYPAITSGNFSFAMLGFTPTSLERLEWKETLNTSAVVMSDRAIGTNPQDISSNWTAAGSGDWRGGVVTNDNSVSFETTHIADNTRYGSSYPDPANPGSFIAIPPNPTDDIFDADPNAADAFNVYENATTSYSPQ